MNINGSGTMGKAGEFVSFSGNVADRGRRARPCVGDGGLEGGGRTLCCLARVITSRRNVAN